MSRTPPRGAGRSCESHHRRVFMEGLMRSQAGVPRLPCHFALKPCCFKMVLNFFLDHFHSFKNALKNGVTFAIFLKDFFDFFKFHGWRPGRRGVSPRPRTPGRVDDSLDDAIRGRATGLPNVQGFVFLKTSLEFVFFQALNSFPYSQPFSSFQPLSVRL